MHDRRPRPGPRAGRRPAGRGPAATGSSRSAAGAWSTSPRRSPPRPAGGVRAMAVPTTLSGAEMTRGHRHARGVDESTPRVRPRSSSSIPRSPPRSRSPSSPRARSTRSATPSKARARCARTRSRRSPPTRPRGCSSAGWASEEPDRETLALGALLAGYVIDSTGPRPAPRARPDAGARRRRRPRPRQRGAAAAHDRRAGATRAGGDRGARRRRPNSPAACRRSPARRTATRSASTAPGSARPPTPPRRARSSPTRRPAADRDEILAIYEAAL